MAAAPAPRDGIGGTGIAGRRGTGVRILARAPRDVAGPSAGDREAAAGGPRAEFVEQAAFGALGVLPTCTDSTAAAGSRSASASRRSGALAIRSTTVSGARATTAPIDASSAPPARSRRGPRRRRATDLVGGVVGDLRVGHHRRAAGGLGDASDALGAVRLDISTAAPAFRVPAEEMDERYVPALRAASRGWRRCYR